MDDLALTRILKNGDPLPDDTSLAVEALIYEGVDSRIIMTREYFVKFNCEFDLLMYPFDTQICNMQLQVFRHWMISAIHFQFRVVRPSINPLR